MSVPEQEEALLCSVSSTLEDTERRNDEESQRQSLTSDLKHTHRMIINIDCLLLKTIEWIVDIIDVILEGEEVSLCTDADELMTQTDRHN